MKCIPLRKFLEEYLQLECEACKNVIRQIIAVLGLKENGPVLPITVECCALSEGGTCTVPLPCPKDPVIAIAHRIDFDILERKWVEEICVHELVTDTRRCIVREATRQEPLHEVEFVNSYDKAVEILSKFGLSRKEIRKLVG